MPNSDCSSRAQHGEFAVTGTPSPSTGLARIGSPVATGRLPTETAVIWPEDVGPGPIIVIMPTATLAAAQATAHGTVSPRDGIADPDPGERVAPGDLPGGLPQAHRTRLGLPEAA